LIECAEPRRDQTEDLGRDVRIILEWILKKVISERRDKIQLTQEDIMNS